MRARSRGRFERRLYRSRNVVERCIGHLKEYRRLATRHEKLALNYRARAQVAVIARHLRRLAPSDSVQDSQCIQAVRTCTPCSRRP